MCVYVFFFKREKRNVCTLIFLFPSFNILRWFLFMIKRRVCSLKANVIPVLHIMDAFNVPSSMLRTHPLSFEFIASCSDLPALGHSVHITNEMNALLMQQKAFIFFLFCRKVFPYPLAIANFSIQCLICFIVTLNCNWISLFILKSYPVGHTIFWYTSAMCNITILMKCSNCLSHKIMAGFEPFTGTTNTQTNKQNQ